MKNIMIAAAALTIGFGAATLPAMAQDSYTGVNVWQQNDPTRFAPAGTSAENNDFAGARDISEQRQMLYSRKDSFHKAY